MSRRLVPQHLLPEPPIGRRSFLRSLSGAAAAVSLPVLLSACGGGGDSGAPIGSPGGGDGSGGGAGSGGGGGGSGGAPSDATRLAVLGTVEQHCRDLAAQALAPLAFVEAVATHMRSLVAYVEVGVDADTLTAWGAFADGRIHLVANNHRPRRANASGAAPRASAQASVNEVPSAATARVLQTFGPDFDSADTVTALAKSLRQVGYGVRAGDPHHAGVEALREVRGDGYFYINTHGGAFQPTIVDGVKQAMYSIQSSTFVSPTWEDEPTLRGDLDLRRITYFTAHNGDTILGIEDWDTRYGITASFVAAYWSFAPDSVVVINACSSARVADATWSAGFVAACHKAGAGVYLGWNETVSPAGAYHATQYFTDRLLGANAFEPEVPAQRPFPWDAVMADMHKKAVDIDPGTSAVFLALPKPASTTVQFLAPSIHHVGTEEYRDELRLFGRFGSTRGEVFIDATPRTIKDWTPERIVVDLPRTGAGSCGPVQVLVRGLKSNVRQLTEWAIDLDYTWIMMEAQGLKVAGLGRVRLRADVGATREAPGEAPVQPVRNTIATRESNLPLVASGSYPVGPCSIDWSGSAVYQAIPPEGTKRELIAYLKADTAARRGSLGLALGSATPDFTQSGCTTSKFQAIFGPLAEQVMYPSPIENSTNQIPLHSLALPFDERYGIAAGKFETLIVRLKWQAVEASHPPEAGDGV